MVLAGRLLDRSIEAADQLARSLVGYSSKFTCPDEGPLDATVV